MSTSPRLIKPSAPRSKQQKRPNKRRSTTELSPWLAYLATLSSWVFALAMLIVAGLLAPNVAPQLMTLLRGLLGLP